ncbi:hypothetical protein [Novosphingobium terrae]|uniref:hypothetical protein n=1 Tax=Novosphingobium terrae TaxID=2726189 RepID=UPI0019825E75|nr:hypothetical protein [Novosphingobium terrae]
MAAFKLPLLTIAGALALGLTGWLFYSATEDGLVTAILTLALALTLAPLGGPGDVGGAVGRRGS